MPTTKFAISIPPAVMAEVDRAAASRGVTRSRFIADVLERVASARSDREITRRLDALFADESLNEEQRATAAAFGTARTDAGTRW